MAFQSNHFRRHHRQLEQLESRICLSINPTFSAGVLSIAGSPENDTVLIGDTGQGIVTVRDGTSDPPWEFQGVEKIIVETGEGADKIRFTRLGGDLPIPELDITSGGGEDQVLIGMLLPAVQKVREAAARAKVDLGGESDFLRINATGVDQLDLDLTGGGGDDQILIGMLLPAVQKVRESAARVNVDLGEGDDFIRANANGVDLLDLDLTAGEGDDEVLIGMLVPAVQKVREAAARMTIDLGDDNDFLRANTAGVDRIELDLTAGEGDDQVLIGMLLPAVQKVREAAARMNIDLGDGNDFLRANLTGFDAVDAVFDAGAGDDDLMFGLLLPALPQVRAAAESKFDLTLKLGEGSDTAGISTHGYSHIATNIDTGPAEDGSDRVASVHFAPRPRPFPLLRRFVTPLDGGKDISRLRAVGYESVDVTTEQTRQVTIIQDI